MAIDLFASTKRPKRKSKAEVKAKVPDKKVIPPSQTRKKATKAELKEVLEKLPEIETGKYSDSDKVKPSNLPREKLESMASSGRPLIKLEDFYNPVTQSFIASACRLDPKTVSKRLKGFMPCARAGTRPLYDFAAALPKVIKSEMAVQTLIDTLNPNDLPPAVNKTIWEARRIKLKYEIEAQMSWQGETVMFTLGEMCKALSEIIDLLPGKMKRLSVGKTLDYVLGKIEEEAANLKSTIYDYLVTRPSKKSTKPLLYEENYSEDFEFTDNIEED